MLHGGFTHFLLLNGATRVYGVDVDVTQLDWRLQSDPRVIKFNAMPDSSSLKTLANSSMW
jgi:predicted rRNA methylase YqxC with S4 and FtsJ domains